MLASLSVDSYLWWEGWGESLTHMPASMWPPEQACDQGRASSAWTGGPGGPLFQPTLSTYLPDLESILGQPALSSLGGVGLIRLSLTRILTSLDQIGERN